MITKVAISGVSSEVGKTTLLCNLLRELPGWEAIKMTRGHYRSCGKDPHACCVSALLGAEPLVRSGFRQTYVRDKDTGRYWEAGASNVHWVVVTDDQVERGINLALERVKAAGVLIEGNSFLQFVDVDFGVLVTREGKPNPQIKRSSRWAFAKASALFVFDQLNIDNSPSLNQLHRRLQTTESRNPLPAYTANDLSSLVSTIKSVRTQASRIQEYELQIT
jgi:hypothetical protein